MPAELTYAGFRVFLTSDGKPMETYSIEKEADRPTITSWVASEEGKVIVLIACPRRYMLTSCQTFKIDTFRVSSRLNVDVRWRIDGKTLAVTSLRKHQPECAFSHLSTGPTEKSELVFSALELSGTVATFC